VVRVGVNYRFGGQQNVITETPSVTQLSQVITQAIAPAFLLGALAAFISVLTLRMNRVADRSQMLNAIGDADKARAHLKADLPRMQQRATLLNNATFFATLSAIFATVLVMVAFVSAFFNIENMNERLRCYLLLRSSSLRQRWSTSPVRRGSRFRSSIIIS
jgi:hypothetical protein